MQFCVLETRNTIRALVRTLRGGWACALLTHCRFDAYAPNTLACDESLNACMI